MYCTTQHSCDFKISDHSLFRTRNASKSIKDGCFFMLLYIFIIAVGESATCSSLRTHLCICLLTCSEPLLQRLINYYIKLMIQHSGVNWSIGENLNCRRFLTTLALVNCSLNWFSTHRSIF